MWQCTPVAESVEDGSYYAECSGCNGSEHSPHSTVLTMCLPSTKQTQMWNTFCSMILVWLWMKSQDRSLTTNVSAMLVWQNARSREFQRLTAPTVCCGSCNSCFGCCQSAQWQLSYRNNVCLSSSHKWRQQGLSLLQCLHPWVYSHGAYGLWYQNCGGPLWSAAAQIDLSSKEVGSLRRYIHCQWCQWCLAQRCCCRCTELNST